MIESGQWLISTNKTHDTDVFNVAEEESSKHHTFKYIDKGKLHHHDGDGDSRAWRIF